MLGPYKLKHTYSIQEMIDLHGESKLVMDDTLAVMVIGDMIKQIYDIQGNIQGSASADDYTKKMINRYNLNAASFDTDAPDGVGGRL
jgi:hypothetical protein